MFMVGSSVTPPAGWTVKFDDAGAACALAYHWVDGTEGASTGAWGGALFHQWAVLVRGSIGSGDPFASPSYRSYTFPAPNTAPSEVNPTEADSLLLWFEGNFGPTTLPAAPAGMTAWLIASGYVHMAYETRRAAGATGIKQVAPTTGAQSHIILAAIKGRIPHVIVGGVKKPVTEQAVIIGGVKKPITEQSILVNQTKKELQ